MNTKAFEAQFKTFTIKVNVLTSAVIWLTSDSHICIYIPL